jgi:hypothetical protein
MRPVAPRVITVGPMVSAWVLVALTALAALWCAFGAYRLARRPRGTQW